MAEFQRRGVVHFHTLWRLDARAMVAAAPPAEFDEQLLVDAITAALPKASVPAEGEDTDPYEWGREQRSVRSTSAVPSRRPRAWRAISPATATMYRRRWRRPLPDRERTRAGRLAPPRARAPHDHRRLARGRLRRRAHEKRMRRWAHQFGFGGHRFTKSRRFSTTFKALREARAQHSPGLSATAVDASAKVTTT